MSVFRYFAFRNRLALSFAVEVDEEGESQESGERGSEEVGRSLKSRLCVRTRGPGSDGRRLENTK
jgi:hypothetical protein